LDRDLRKHYRSDNPDIYARNVDVQIGVFLANHMFLQLLEARGVHAQGSLGMSLGEYNHLVHIGALDFESALATVKVRGEAYDAGPRGWMAAVQPMEVEELQEVVAQVQSQSLGCLELVNFNSPRQNVLSGDQAAVEAAIKLLEDEHYVHPVVIERQVPMHSSLFASVGEQFRTHLATQSFQKPKLAYWPNRLGRALDHPTQDDFVEMLSSHVCSPVLWRHSIDHVIAGDPDAVFVEVGPKAVLCNMLSRKWHRNTKFHCDSAEDTPAHLDSMLATLNECLAS
jgi:[acyl-carrier-protein] S-malonyltransferase